ncbi:MAG: NAD-glutamate dehydrogenase domain-containing protein [Campylobacterota bacterium]
MDETIRQTCGDILSKDDFVISKKVQEALKKEDLHIEFDKNSRMKLYSTKKIILSDVVPTIHSFGFLIDHEISYNVDDICIIKVNLIVDDVELLLKNRENTIAILKARLCGKLRFDCPLFQLTYKQNFSKREFELFDAVAEYQNQLFANFNRASIVHVLTLYPKTAKAALELFHAKFNPELKPKKTLIKQKQEAFLESLKDISGINDDKIAKTLYEILDNMTRTNYFLGKETISFKVNVKGFKNLLRGTQPNIEAFVHSQYISGTHNRTGKVCRGGLRWSDRKDDFRDEVKSLMTAQEGKNAVIIPNGSKGGFVIHEENITKECFEGYYKQYINALLDLVDNKVDNKIVRDERTVAYDGEDSYFVVAADKGTASMSDVANGISIERGFWLGDAFASGGSRGYHHKKLGITAKGAIKSSFRHFIEKGVDFYKESITVVGIGSMNGDVFGNGMVESDKFKLLGAISHREIFIDPDPDPQTSYEERKRLFESGNGAWSEYKKFSKGGAVFKRNQKNIDPSPEIRELLKIKTKTIDADELAKKLLTLKVDMLYNGGVGTYVKSSDESDIEVGDKENEYVRVDANELKAYCVCEGGNLGFTQKARVEYALKGGRINLDSIDNSAGVDTSDHEVNFKILLNILEKKNLVDNKYEVLEELAPHVVNSVLWTNYFQSLSISLDEERSRLDIKKFEKTLEVLSENLDFFNKKSFAIEEFKFSGGKIIRPMLSILTMYSKIFIKNKLLSSDMIDDKDFNVYLYKYFPKTFIVSFEDQIKHHPLKKQIIATVIANRIVNFYGSTFIHDYNKLGQENFLIKIKSYLIMNDLFGTNDIRFEIFRKDFEIPTTKQYKLLIDIEDAIDYSVNTMLTMKPEDINFESVLSHKDNLDRVLTQIMQSKVTLVKSSEEINRFFSKVHYLKLVTDILIIEHSTEYTFLEVAELFFYIVDKLKLNLLVQKVKDAQTKDDQERVIKSQLDCMIRHWLEDMMRRLLSFRRNNETVEQTLFSYLEETTFEYDYYNEFVKKDLKLKELSILVNYLNLSTNFKGR